MKKIKSNMNYPFLKSGNFTRNLIIVCIITLLQMVNTSYAQCYTSAPCSGGGALPSYSITSTIVLASGTYKFGNNTLTISGSSTTYTISNSCIEFDYSTSAIIVTNGATLVLDNCILYSSSGSLWQGIKVNSPLASSTVILKSGTVIGDAVRGVWSNSSATYESIFDVTGSTFCHCQYGIYMSPFSSGIMSSKVNGTIFNGGTLLGGGNSLAGIYMNGIGTGVNVFPIGNTAAYGTSTNEFTGMNRGIFAEDSYFSVQDCNFHDMYNVGSNGYGIYSKNTDATEDVLVVGALTGYGFNNHFDNCRIAIFGDDDVKTSVAENLFTSDYNIDIPDGYTMEKAIRIENSTSLVAVSGNDIENYEQHGVWLKNISDDYAAIFENTFNLTPGFNSSSPAMAIRVFETSMTDDLVLHIYDNIIYAGRTGIYVNNITPINGQGNIIYNNEIYFSSGDDPDNAYGIKVIDCVMETAPVMVMSNYCEGNGEHEDYVRGIYFEDTQGFWCLSNHVNNCSIGIYCLGAVTESIINCNMLEDCPGAGMFFNNIGSGTTILYPNMTATGDPSGNFWLPDDPGTNRGESYGLTNFGSFTWIFSDNGATETEYWMPNPCFPGGLGTLAPTNIGGANECSGIPYMRLSGEDEEDDIFSELINMYGVYADAFNNNYPEGSLNDFYTLSGFWENVAGNGYNPEELPDNLLDLYEYIAVTNIPDIVELKHTISARDYEEAGTLLENISPANDIEYYIIRTSELFLNHLNDVGIFEINDEILPEIRSIAVLNGWDYGRGVYMARALMDTTIEFNMPEEEEKLGIHARQDIVVNPNPAYEFITLQFTNTKPVTDLTSVEIFGLSGVVLKKVYTTNNIIDVSSLPNGIYLLKVSYGLGQKCYIKLEILK